MKEFRSLEEVDRAGLGECAHRAVHGTLKRLIDAYAACGEEYVPEDDGHIVLLKPGAHKPGIVCVSAVFRGIRFNVDLFGAGDEPGVQTARGLHLRQQPDPGQDRHDQPGHRGAGASEKIAMTSPVIEEPVDGVQRVSFIMPSEYTLEDLPEPVNEKVRLVAVAERMVAVARFSWRGRDEHMRAREQKLREALARDGVEITGPPTYARYDPPWTLPLFRRNEVMLPVAYDEAASSR